MFFGAKKKTELKKWHVVVILLIILAAVGFRIYSSFWPRAWVSIGDKRIKVLVADNHQRQVRGWSGRRNMGRYGGMLFLYTERGEHVMVMRDMNFPLDIVWLDRGVVVDFAPNVQPEPGCGERQLMPYFSRLPANMVLELPAGFTISNNVKIGDRVKIEK